MGLDMYLFAKDKNNIDKKIIEIGYWRKANAIHKWFVDNIQDGNDDCKNYKIDIDNISKLKETCEQVKNNTARAYELLPTQEGFFFGSTEYDGYYFENIGLTIEICDRVLNEFKDNNYELTYTSWW